jgi:hypoxanthine phosphoribosyltransferase
MSKPIPFRSSEEIQERLEATARQINQHYAGRSLDIVGAVNGASMFCADLVRRLDVPVVLHWLAFSSYSPGTPSGEVRLTQDVDRPLYGRHVLLVEGIIVSGRTPRYVVDLLRLRQPASIEVCAIGFKPQALAVELPIAYSLFEFGAEIVVGYGVGDGPEKTLPYLASRKA